MGQRLAERLRAKVGDRLPLQDGHLEITGLVRQASILADNVIVVPLGTLQRLLRKQGLITALDLHLDKPGDPREVARVQSRLADLFPDLNFYETKEAVEANRMLQLLRRLSWSMSLVALLMALFFITNTLLMSVTETTREMGILSALGWSRSRIMAKVLLEGLLVSALGSVLGLVCGLTSLHLFATWTLLEGFIEPRLSAIFVVQIFAASTLIGCLGSLYPAWRTTRLNTVEALRFE